jgi:hypothetical protein
MGMPASGKLDLISLQPEALEKGKAALATRSPGAPNRQSPARLAYQREEGTRWRSLALREKRKNSFAALAPRG